SFTLPNGRWYAFQWLTGVIFAALNRAFGLKGIVLLCGVVIAATLVIMLRTAMLRKANGLIAMVLVLLAGNAMSIHFHARPHLFTLLFLAIAQFLIAKDMQSRSRTFWLIVPM